MGVLKEHSAPLGARESCSQELPDLSQTSCVVLLGLLVFAVNWADGRKV